ncbi:MAG: YicC/YloC family endoribonuclease [Pseudomonadota bacterium]
MVNSMTGFSARSAQAEGYSWSWELRSVNGKGLDLRLRLPDWIEGLEPLVRRALSAAIGRGNISLSLRIAADESATIPKLNTEALDRVLAGLAQIQATATAQGLVLAPPSPVDILNQRSVQEMGTDPANTADLRGTLVKDLAQLIEQFQQMRANEGQALQGLVRGHLATITELIADARTSAEATQSGLKDKVRQSVERLLEASDGLEAGRLEQELALIAVKSDVTEELDRLNAHVEASGALLENTDSIGRKLDFLCQEFNREANTLCSKSQSVELTRIGLDLKTVIDQMREQVQNIE